MNSLNLSVLRGRSGLFVALGAVWILILTVVLLLFKEVEKSKQESTKGLEKDLLSKAVSHFEDILVFRSWNASHGGVYVKAENGMKPNAYLRDNVMHSDKNETYIKINPAWMTRQVSELSNRYAKYYYRMSSLKPINPINKADDFEKEALEFFENNKEQPYYVRFVRSGDGVTRFNFMGSLKVKQECLQCHGEQGYKVGDIRGGIRVILPLEEYRQKAEVIKSQSLRSKLSIVVFGVIIGLLVSVYLIMMFYHQKEIELLNKELEDKVDERTRELKEMNETLERRVVEEVEENRKKDEAMLTQSRYLAMGEVIEMISHQWRQPISVIGAIASHMMINIELEIDSREEMKKELEKLSSEIQQLSRIITQFSDLFEEDSQEHPVRPCDVLNEILSVMKSSFEHNNITVETSYTKNCEIMLISRDLFQVYWNIINNAKEILIERAIEEPKIKIETKKSEEGIVTYIADNGGGIEEKYIDKIFEPYFSTKEDLNGKGLGLYIAKSLLEKKIHGTITVHNNDQGALFIITIPNREVKST